MRCKFYIYSTTIFIVFFFACIAVADIYDPGADIEASFAEAIENDALFDTPSIQKTAKLVKKFNNENDSADGDQLLENGLSSLKEIVFYARGKLDRNNKLEDKLLKSIESVWRQLSGSKPQNELTRATNWIIDENDFTVNLIPKKLTDENDLTVNPKELTDENDPTVNPKELTLDFKTTYLDKAPLSPDAYRHAIDALGILKLTQQTMDYIKRKAALERIGSVARKRTAQWQVYFDESIPQWPWELAFVNGPIYGNKLKNEKGLGKVPDWQLIVAHPDIALEYVDGAADGDQFRAALMVEIIGADFWSWEDGAKQKGPGKFPIPLGLGFVATFADRADSDDWGFGGVIHFNHVYNLGAIFRGSDTGIFVSLNLAKLFENKSKKAEKYLDMVGLR